MAWSESNFPFPSLDFPILLTPLTTNPHLSKLAFNKGYIGICVSYNMNMNLSQSLAFSSLSVFMDWMILCLVMLTYVCWIYRLSGEYLQSFSNQSRKKIHFIFSEVSCTYHWVAGSRNFLKSMWNTYCHWNGKKSLRVTCCICPVASLQKGVIWGCFNCLWT